MKKLSYLLNFVFALAILLLLYFGFFKKNNLKEVRNLINEAKSELIILQDSLSKTENSIKEMIKTLQISETELNILKNEREIIELREKQRITKNLIELQEIKNKIEEKENNIEELKKIAEKFEL